MSRSNQRPARHTPTAAASVLVSVQDNGTPFVVVAVPVLELNSFHWDVLVAAAKATRRTPYQPDQSDPWTAEPLAELRRYELMAGNTITDKGRLALRMAGLQ
ncbi:MAG TPA: hypothetical protein VHX38_02755 [Pseudonocardiaceae bacterium]|jgi:hypothetical protein|nr:hypothetical protein [Pseudonocardiaceae bacterium]